MKEIWKDIKGYEGVYQVSSFGRVKSLPRTVVDSLGRVINKSEKLLSQRISSQTRYPMLNLFKDGVRKTFNVHRLVAEAFIPNTYNLPCINHKDESRDNNNVENLEWCTYLYNNTYGTAMEKRKTTLRKNLEGEYKTIYQFTKDGRLVAVFDCGRSQVEEKLGYEISQSLIGKSKTAHGYVFSYCKDFSYKEDLPKKHQKYVIQIDDNNKEIRRFKSKLEVERVLGIDRHRLCLGGYCSVNGYKFIVEKK